MRSTWEQHVRRPRFQQVERRHWDKLLFTSCVFFRRLLPVIVSFEEFENPPFTSAFTSPALAVCVLLAEPTMTFEFWSAFQPVPASMHQQREEPIRRKILGPAVGCKLDKRCVAFAEFGRLSVVHCINRCVRRAYLCGQDPVTGTDYEHRRELIRQRLEFLAGIMGIEVFGYLVTSNHFSLYFAQSACCRGDMVG